MSKKTKNTDLEAFTLPDGHVLGVVAPKIDIRDYKAVAAVSSEDIEIPESFELDMPFKIKDQGSVSSCVAFSLSEIIEYFNLVQEGSYKEFSTGYIYGNRRCGYKRQGYGMCEKDALQAILKWGDVPNSLFNSNIEVPDAITKFEEAAFELSPDAYPNRISSYYKIDSEREAKLSLLKNGPLLLDVAWYGDYYVEKNTNLLKHRTTQLAGYHALVAYGWNKDGWLVQNSWGPRWGNKGCAVLPYEDGLVECFGIIDNISEHQREIELTNLKESIAKYETDLAKYQKKEEKLETSIEQLQQSLALSNAQLQEIQAEIDSLTKEFTDLGEDASRTKKYKTLQNLLRNRQEAEAELKAIIADQEKILASDQKALDKLQQKIDTADEELAKKDLQIKALENQLLDIEKPYQKMPKWLALIINAIINCFKKIK